MEAVRTLVDRQARTAKPVLPPQLHELYDGDLYFPASAEQRPYVVANFVSTLDGVVSYRLAGHSAGSTISGSDPGDRFIMGLLRASVDAVIVGAHTIHDVGPESLWIPEYTYPEGKRLYSDYRVNVLHKREYPLVVIVSGSGRLDLKRSVFRTAEAGTLIVTTAAGQKELAAAGAASLHSVAIRTLEDRGGSIHPISILQLLVSEFGVQTLLHEGGPTLFTEFLATGFVDELFMTLAPQLAGRTSLTIRPGLVEGVEFLPGNAPWFQLLSVKEKAEHLYLRYRRTGTPPLNGVSQNSVYRS
jgi:riboflavin biosynthesis pyrimidine reductase